MLKNRHNLIILLLGLVFVLSGCFKKEVKPMVENIKPSPVVNVENANNEKVDETTAEKLDEIFTTPIEEWSKEVWPPKEMVEKFDYTGWKTYVNEELKYSIKYPPDWTYAVFNPSTHTTDAVGAKYTTLVYFYPPKPEEYTNYISIIVLEKDQDSTMFRLNVNKEDGGLIGVEDKKIFLNYKAYQYTSYKDTNIPNERITDFTFIDKNNSDIFKINTDKYDDKEVPQIMASFKFID